MSEAWNDHQRNLPLKEYDVRLCQRGDSLHQSASALEMYSYGAQHCNPRHAWGPGVKNYSLLHYVYQGKGRLITEEMEYSITAGQIFFIPQDIKVFYQADEQQPWHYFWLAFVGYRCDELMSMAGLTRQHPVINCIHRELFEKYALQLLTTDEEAENSAFKQQGMLLLFMSVLTGGAKMPARSHNVATEHAIAYMDAHYATIRSVKEISDIVHLECKYFMKVFKEKTGRSPGEYLNRLRMERAEALLGETALLISEVAYSVGYSNQFSFSRAFTREMGISPTAYRAGASLST